MNLYLKERKGKEIQSEKEKFLERKGLMAASFLSFKITMHTHRHFPLG